MMRFAAGLAALVVAVGLSACVPGAAKTEAGNPLAAEAITTTSLDTPKPSTEPPAGPATAAKPAAAAAQPTAPPRATPQSATPAPDAAATDPSPAAAPPSPEELRCLKRGGTWVGAGPGGAKACVRMTRDAGKECRKQSQCEGFCRARSGTCAPFTPMFGCNDILQDDGREVTLCLD